MRPTITARTRLSAASRFAFGEGSLRSSIFGAFSRLAQMTPETALFGRISGLRTTSRFRVFSCGFRVPLHRRIPLGEMTRWHTAKVARDECLSEIKDDSKSDLQAGVTARHFSGVAARRCSGLLCIGRRPGRERSPLNTSMNQNFCNFRNLIARKIGRRLHNAT